MNKNNQHKILVVEDDKIIRESISYVLESEGYEVNAAENGFEALKILRSHTAVPCLILLDISMPIMDGFQFRDEQLKDSTISEIPVVVITADGHASQKAAKIGAQGWAKKPVEIDEIIKIAERYC